MCGDYGAGTNVEEKTERGSGRAGQSHYGASKLCLGHSCAPAGARSGVHSLPRAGKAPPVATALRAFGSKTDTAHR